MAQKTVMSLLVVTIVGAIFIGIYDAVRPSLASNAAAAVATQVPPVQPTAEVIENPVVINETLNTTQAEPVQQSLDMVGEPWMADGVITALDDFGMTLNLPDGSSVYVELGPPTFWQAQHVPLAVDESVFIAGFSNGEQVHAATVMLPDGSLLSLRNATGQPLWSGGAGGGNVQGQSEPTTQISPEDWGTIEGVITAIANSSVTVQTADGPMTLQLGQQRFWENQGVTLAVDDEIKALGIWQSNQFQVAEVTKVQTGERIMLRDPNGRPLWAGPGSNGQASNSQGQANGGQGVGGGNGNNQGNGNGYRGGRGGN